MKFNRYIIFVFISCLVIGCGITNSLDEPMSYSIVSQGVENENRQEKYNILTVDRVRVEEPFDSKEIFYRLSDINFKGDYYHQYITEPGNIIEHHILSKLTDSGIVGQAIPYSVGVSTNLILNTVVTRLYGDFRKDKQAFAVLEIQFILLDRTESRQKIIFDTHISSEIPLDRKNPDSLVIGFGQALEDILESLIDEIENTE